MAGNPRHTVNPLSRFYLFEKGEKPIIFRSLRFSRPFKMNQRAKFRIALEVLVDLGLPMNTREQWFACGCVRKELRRHISRIINSEDQQTICLPRQRQGSRIWNYLGRFMHEGAEPARSRFFLKNSRFRRCPSSLCAKKPYVQSVENRGRACAKPRQAMDDASETFLHHGASDADIDNGAF